MARVAIISYDLQTIGGKAGGVAAFATRWARLLRAAGEDVTLIMTRTDWEPKSVDIEWKARYQSEGIGLIELQSPPPLATRWPEVPTMRIAEIAAPVLKNFDIVYFQDWGNAAFQLVRERRFHIDQGPVCVTVLHGPSEWELSSNERYPKLPGDLHLAYQERYAAAHSDFVVSPSHYMAEHLRTLGWQYPGEVEVLGLPMPPQPPRPETPAPQIRRIVYFARIEERKGIRLFVRAMQHLAKQTNARPEIVLLGASKDDDLLDSARRGLKSAGFAVTHRGDLNSDQAARYLREHAAETLCVIPSPADNFPYTVVEASLIPGLNLVACNGGGVPEILAHAQAQLSDPLFRDLAAKIAERLEKPLGDEALAHYDCAAAADRWLNFHRRALAHASQRITKTLPSPAPTVDVCTTYFQKASYLPQFVNALEHQTTPDFQVIAVNDGSPDDLSNRVFAEQAERVAARGWTFVRQENAFVDAARNSAARLGSGEYLLFIDSDDVPAPTAVEHLRDALSLAGADALICASYLFASDGSPCNLTTGEPTVPAFAICIPLGMDLVGGMVDPSSFGGSMFIVRRSAFEAVGGFTEQPGAGHEDWELYVRLTLAGYDVDVLPELLQFYRQVEGSLARTLGSEASRRRLLSAYEDRMRAAGLSGGALALAGLHEHSKVLENRLRLLEARVNAPQGGYAFFSGATRRFEPESSGVNLSGLQAWYRRSLSMETRLKIHRIFLAPFLGPYEPPSA